MKPQEVADRNQSRLFAATSVNLAMFAYTPLFAIAEQNVGLWLYLLLMLIPISIALIAVHILQKDGLKPVGLLCGILLLVGLNVFGFLLKTSVLAGILAFAVLAIVYGVRSFRESKAERTEPRTAAMVGIVFGAIPLLLAAVITYILSNLKFTF